MAKEVERHRGAPTGNKNRELPVERRKPQTFQANVSLDREHLGMLRQAMALNGGSWADDIEVKAQLRLLARQAVEAYFEQACTLSALHKNK